MNKLQTYLTALLTPLTFSCVRDLPTSDQFYTPDAVTESSDSTIKPRTDTLTDILYDTPTLEPVDIFLDTDKKISDLTETQSLDTVVSDIENKEDVFVGCYNNTFTTENDFTKVITDTDFWIWNKKGYVQQKESGSGNKTAIVDTPNYADFEASVKFRMIDSGIGVNQYTAFPFRYDFIADKGYALVIGHADGNTFSFALHDWPKGPIKGVNLDCSPNISTTDCGVMYNNWYTIKVKAIGDKLTAYFEGEEVFTTQKNIYSSGKIGFATISVRADFDDVNICPLK